MTSEQHNKPCAECPFKKTSARGYLGASNPVEFLSASESGQFMPCHMAVDYESDDWEDTYKDAPQCAGRAIHFANRCKGVQGTRVMKASPDDSVITWPQEFIDHHTPVGEVPRILIVGNVVLTTEKI